MPSRHRHGRRALQRAGVYPPSPEHLPFIPNSLPRTVGDPFDWGVKQGPQVDRAQFENVRAHTNKVQLEKVTARLQQDSGF